MTAHGYTFDCLIAHLDTLNPGDVGYHADRYESAEKYMRLIIDAQCNRIGSPTALKTDVTAIAYACADDGADFGSIPCLGGKPQQVWQWLKDTYL